jgi:hypothetical protein
MPLLGVDARPAKVDRLYRYAVQSIQYRMYFYSLLFVCMPSHQPDMKSDITTTMARALLSMAMMQMDQLLHVLNRLKLFVMAKQTGSPYGQFAKSRHVKAVKNTNHKNRLVLFILLPSSALFISCAFRRVHRIADQGG